MITFQVERWPEFWRDCQELTPIHWAEAALDRDKIKLSIKPENYQVCDENGILHIVTARDRTKMVGYFVANVVIHPHYKEAGLMAFTDMYFIHPDYRRGGTGAKLLLEVERTLKERGVVKIYISTKVHENKSALLKALGYKPADLSFTKMIGGK
jgi:N-acetylglutamate synthase-like GNAT family acetyltransferase